MGDVKPDDALDVRSVAAIRGFLVFVVPLGAIIAAYFSTRAATESTITEIKRDVKHLTETVKRIESDLLSARADLRTHSSMGPDGLPHPQGVIVELRDLRMELGNINDRVIKLERK